MSDTTNSMPELSPLASDSIRRSELESQLTALREKNAELEKDFQVVKGMYHGACDIIKQLEGNEVTIAELQRQLDEAAKQEPYRYIYKIVDSWGNEVWSHDHFGEKILDTIPLYRLPPNLLAIIEQAKNEERQEIISKLKELLHGLPEYKVISAIKSGIRARKP